MKAEPAGLARIERALPADLPAIRELLAQAELPTADIGDALLPGFLVLRERGRVRGVAAVEALGTCGLLRSVAVAPDLRSQGHGSRLAAAAEELAESRGLSPLYLLTTTAAEYFARRGYRPVDRAALPAEVRATREFSTLCPDTAIAMVRP